MTERQAEIARESLSRAENGQSLTNLPAIYQGFLDRGIPEADILPRENVLTYHAWRAKGRQVRRGEHGGRVTTWIPLEVKDADGNPETIRGEQRVKLSPKS